MLFSYEIRVISLVPANEKVHFITIFLTPQLVRLSIHGSAQISVYKGFYMNNQAVDLVKNFSPAAWNSFSNLTSLLTTGVTLKSFSMSLATYFWLEIEYKMISRALNIFWNFLLKILVLVAVQRPTDRPGIPRIFYPM